MKIEANTIEEFFENSGEYEEALRFLDRIIMKKMPVIDRKLYFSEKSTTIGYGEIPYHTKDYPTVPILAIAPQKSNISIYSMAWMGDKSLVEIYSDRLGKVSCGKGCVRVKKLEGLDLETFDLFLEDIYKVYQSTEKNSVI